MSSKRRVRQKECGRKQRYPDRGSAGIAIQCLHRNKGYQGFISPYPCRWCSGWHIGHVKGHAARNW